MNHSSMSQQQQQQQSSVREILRIFRAGGGSLSSGRKRHLETELANLKSRRVCCAVNDKEKTRANTYNVKWINLTSAFSNRLRTGVVINLRHTDIKAFLREAFILIDRRLKRMLRKRNCLKVNFVFAGDFIKTKIDSKDDVLTAQEEEDLEKFRRYYSTKNRTISRIEELKKLKVEVEEELFRKLIECAEKSSSLAIANIINLTVNISQVTPFTTAT